MARTPRTLRARLTLLYALVSLAALLAVGGAAIATIAADVAEDNAERAAQGLPPEGIDPGQRALLVGLAVALPSALALAGFAGWLVAGRALRPLRAIADVVRAISADDLGRRVPTGGGAEVDALGRELHKLFARLERSLDDTTRFTANAAHELRTPLQVVMGRLEVELLHGRGEDSAREAMSDALDELSRLRALIDGLLVLARAGAGQLPMADEAVDLFALAERVVERDRPLAEDRAIVLDLAASGPVAARGDRLLLERAVGNLVTNAIVHGRAEGRVSVSVGREGARAVVRVEDDGPGVAPAERERLFQPFHRGDGARTREPHGGFGLGLSIARRIVEAHHGEVTWAPRPSGGSVFSVSLPAPSSDA